MAPVSSIQPRTTGRLASGGQRYGCSRLRSGPAFIHANSASPPSPSGLPGPSSAPATKPSSDADSPTITLPMTFSSGRLWVGPCQETELVGPG
jgi:hypothetical protein